MRIVALDETSCATTFNVARKTRTLNKSDHPNRVRTAFPFAKWAESALGPIGWSKSVRVNQELAVAAAAVIARLGMLVDSATIVARFRLTFGHQLVGAAMLSAIVAGLRFALGLDQFAFAAIAPTVVARLGLALGHQLVRAAMLSAVVAGLRFALGLDQFTFAAVAPTVVARLGLAFRECG